MTDKKERTPAQKAAQFVKGKSGNPAGRTPIPADVKEAAKAHTVTAIETLVNIMVNGKNDASRVGAANAILNRGWGAPKQTVDVDVTHKQDWSALLNALDAHTEAKTMLAAQDQPLVIEAQIMDAEKAD